MITVAVVAQDPTARATLRADLVAAGVAVVAATGSITELLAHPGAHASVVILAIDGAAAEAVTADIHQLNRPGRQVLTTAHRRSTDLIEAVLGDGAVGHVATPTDPATWASAIADAAADRAVLTRETALYLRSHHTVDVAAPPPHHDQVLTLYATGLPAARIAEHLGINTDQVATILDTVRARPGTASRGSTLLSSTAPLSAETGHPARPKAPRPTRDWVLRLAPTILGLLGVAPLVIAGPTFRLHSWITWPTILVVVSTIAYATDVLRRQHDRTVVITHLAAPVLAATLALTVLWHSAQPADQQPVNGHTCSNLNPWTGRIWLSLRPVPQHTDQRHHLRLAWGAKHADLVVTLPGPYYLTTGKQDQDSPPIVISSQPDATIGCGTGPPPDPAKSMPIDSDWQ